MKYYYEIYTDLFKTTYGYTNNEFFSHATTLFDHTKQLFSLAEIRFYKKYFFAIYGECKDKNNKGTIKPYVKRT